MPPDLVLLSTLSGLNYPCLELIFMVPKVYEPLKFDCRSESYTAHLLWMCSVCPKILLQIVEMNRLMKNCEIVSDNTTG